MAGPTWDDVQKPKRISVRLALQVLSGNRRETFLRCRRYHFTIRDDGMRKSAAALATPIFSQPAHGFKNGPLHVIRVAAHVRKNFFERHGIMLGMPAVVISDQSE